MSALTHRQRAEGAAEKTWKRAGKPDGLTVSVVAREMFPGELVEAAKDALSGWRYIRFTHGDLYGVGWDRVEEALAAALDLYPDQEEPEDG